MRKSAFADKNTHTQVLWNCTISLVVAGEKCNHQGHEFSVFAYTTAVGTQKKTAHTSATASMGCWVLYVTSWLIIWFDFKLYIQTVEPIIIDDRMHVYVHIHGMFACTLGFGQGTLCWWMSDEFNVLFGNDSMFARMRYVGQTNWISACCFLVDWIVRIICRAALFRDVDKVFVYVSHLIIRWMMYAHRQKIIWTKILCWLLEITNVDHCALTHC